MPAYANASEPLALVQAYRVQHDDSRGPYKVGGSAVPGTLWFSAPNQACQSDLVCDLCLLVGCHVRSDFARCCKSHLA